MSDLEDALIRSVEREKAREERGGYESDDLGIPHRPLDEYSDRALATYIVARCLVKNYNDYTRGHNRILYKCRGKIMQGKAEIQETKKDLIRLSHYTGRMAPGVEVLAWDILRLHLPEIDLNKIAVRPGVYWDKDGGELVFTKDDLLTI